jgi:hypothetical protein
MNLGNYVHVIDRDKNWKMDDDDLVLLGKLALFESPIFVSKANVIG